MRFGIKLKVIEKEFDLDYRRLFLSFLKKSLETNDKKTFGKLYNKKDPIQKDFTFSVYFGKSKFTKEKIILDSNYIYLNVSVYDDELAIHFYNAFLGMKNVDFRNLFSFEKIEIKKEKNVENEMIFKTLSPIIARLHNKDNNKDKFYTFEDEKFEEVLRINLYNKVKKAFDYDMKNEIEELEIKLLNPKKTVVKNYNLKIPCTLGTFKISGNLDLIDYFYKSGIGAKNGLGFGMIEAI